jgi:hypothetical protein
MSKVATHAAIFKIDLKGTTTYCVMATREKEATVLGFGSMQEGLNYFEEGYNKAHGLGYGYAAGAILNWIMLKPRIFAFENLATLQHLLGEIATPETITATDVYEVVFRCLDQEEGAKVYQSGTEPRLISASRSKHGNAV